MIYINNLCSSVQRFIPAPIQRAGGWVIHKTKETLSNVDARIRAANTIPNQLLALGAVYASLGLVFLSSPKGFEGVPWVVGPCVLMAGGYLFKKGIQAHKSAVKAHESAVKARLYIEQQRTRIDELNQRLSNDLSETVFVAITADDDNQAFNIEGMSNQFEKLAKHYHVRLALIEKPEDYDALWNDLTSRGKKVLYPCFSTHGSPSGVKIAGRPIREYLAGKSFDRCLIDSCHAGAREGEAEAIAREHPSAEVYASRDISWSNGSAYFLDEDDKPALFQMDIQNTLTDVFRGSECRSVPIGHNFCAIDTAFHPTYMEAERKRLQEKASIGDLQAERQLHYLELQRKIDFQSHVSAILIKSPESYLNQMAESYIDDLVKGALKEDLFAKAALNKLDIHELRGRLLSTYEIQENYFPSSS